MLKITIGADPEWGLLNSEGELQYPSFTNNCGSQFGVDGAGRAAELRPDYAHDAKGLVENIRKVLQYVYDNNPGVRQLRWKAGCIVDDEPIGGHVHLGNPLWRPFTTSGRERADKLAMCLKNIVAPLWLMVEPRVEAVARRVGSSYGDIQGENLWREQDWGIEFRTLSSWLTSPEDALAVLTLCQLVAENQDNDKFTTSALQLPDLDRDSFRDCNKKIFSFYLKDIAKTLKMADGFKEKKQDMEHLFQLIIDGKSIDVARDMKDAWGLIKAPAAIEGRRETVNA